MIEIGLGTWFDCGATDSGEAHMRVRFNDKHIASLILDRATLVEVYNEIRDTLMEMKELEQTNAAVAAARKP
jgi:hypothetical protein